VGVGAQAQPGPAREQRQRGVTVTGHPSEPPHELLAAKGVATVLLFKERINGDAVEVDKTRVRILDGGEWSLVFEPLVEPGKKDPLLLSVPFMDVQARAVFQLVSSPSEVDTRLEVTRREPTSGACQEQVAEAQARCAKSGPTRFVREGWLTPQGVRTRDIKGCAPASAAAHGLFCEKGTAYQSGTWVLVDVTIVTTPGQPPWVPREVTLKGVPSQVALPLRSVERETVRLPSGAVRVLVEAEPPKDEEELFILELRDAAGRGLTISEVKSSAKESNP
jgi:uncharacterized protein (TIGR02268 family)